MCILMQSQNLKPFGSNSPASAILARSYDTFQPTINFSPLPIGMNSSFFPCTVTTKGDSHTYHETLLAATAITEWSPYTTATSTSNIISASSGYGTDLGASPGVYIVHPTCLTHFLGLSGSSTLARFSAIAKYVLVDS